MEYSRNLTFHLGGQMEQIFQGLIDRTRARLNVKKLRTIFGFKTRPYRNRKNKSPRLQVVIETPHYSLTIFKLHFGLLTLPHSGRVSKHNAEVPGGFASGQATSPTRR